MAALNLKNAGSVKVINETVQLTGALADLYTVPANGAAIITGIRLSGSDATTGLTADIVNLVSGGSTRYLGKTLAVNPGASVDVWKGNLDEGDKIRGLASTTAKLDVTITGFELAP